jgi:nucleoside-diphosphate-sugar epimerase
MPAIYGPGERTPRLLPNSLAKVARNERPVIQGDGGDLRDQLYVDDAAHAVALAIEKDVVGIFNVADGVPHSVSEVARTAMRVAGMSGDPESAPRAKPRRDYHMSIERARRELGFAARVTLEEGMRRQLEAMRESLAR